MKKERAEKELQKVRAQLEELKEREKYLVECIREAEKNETAEIMEKFKITPEKLLELLKARETENKMILSEHEPVKQNNQNEMENK